MGYNERLYRRAEAIKAIYRTEGLDLTEDEARAIAHQMREKLFWQTVLGVALMVALVAFLIVRFVL